MIDLPEIEEPQKTKIEELQKIEEPSNKSRMIDLPPIEEMQEEEVEETLTFEEEPTENTPAETQPTAEEETQESASEETPPQKPQNTRATEVKNEIVKRFDEKEDVAKIAQDFNMSKDQIAMILRLAGRK